jgi:hypothetical protein
VCKSSLIRFGKRSRCQFRFSRSDILHICYILPPLNYAKVSLRTPEFLVLDPSGIPPIIPDLSLQRMTRHFHLSKRPLTFPLGLTQSHAEALTKITTNITKLWWSLLGSNWRPPAPSTKCARSTLYDWARDLHDNSGSVVVIYSISATTRGFM